MAAVVTNLAACSGGFTWCVIDYRFEKKWSLVGFCSGAIAGLVAITPGSGFVPAWAAIIFGVCSAVACNFATLFKTMIRVDDAMDIFAVHAVAGIVGNLLTGIFAADYIAHLDGFTEIKGGFLNRHWIQLAIQLAHSVSGLLYSFIVTAGLLLGMSALGRIFPVLRLRVDKDEEDAGIDDTEIGEFAYDYVELARDPRRRGVRDSDSSVPHEGNGQAVENVNDRPAQTGFMSSRRPMAGNQYGFTIQR